MPAATYDKLFAVSRSFFCCEEPAHSNYAISGSDSYKILILWHKKIIFKQ
jgi:hypothetical protein